MNCRCMSLNITLNQIHHAIKIQMECLPVSLALEGHCRSEVGQASVAVGAAGTSAGTVSAVGAAGT